MTAQGSPPPLGSMSSCLSALPLSTHTSITALEELCSSHLFTNELFEGKNYLLSTFVSAAPGIRSNMEQALNLH